MAEGNLDFVERSRSGGRQEGRGGAGGLEREERALDTESGAEPDQVTLP